MYYLLRFPCAFSMADLCCIHFGLNSLNDKINSSAFWSSNRFSSPFSFCSAGFLQLSVNQHTHTVTRTEDNPISSSPFVLTQFQVSWGVQSPHLSDSSRFFTFFNYLVTGSILCSCFFCSTFKFKVLCWHWPVKLALWPVLFWLLQKFRPIPPQVGAC